MNTKTIVLCCVVFLSPFVHVNHEVGGKPNTISKRNLSHNGMNRQLKKAFSMAFFVSFVSTETVELHPKLRGYHSLISIDSKTIGCSANNTIHT
jgi:hypothetical protein